MMKLYLSGNSPYARRARLAARVGGLTDQVEEVAIDSFEQLASAGPGGKVPVLICDDGTSLCETLIITRYLNELSGGRLMPDDPVSHLRCLEMESIASVLMDSLFVRSMESNQRDESLRWVALLEREMARCNRCYDKLDELVADADDQVSLASIAVIAALDYASWRAPEDDWRQGRASLAAYYKQFVDRPEFAATAPQY